MIHQPTTADRLARIIRLYYKESGYPPSPRIHKLLRALEANPRMVLRLWNPT